MAASVAARVGGEPVLVESLTDEFSTTVVNPDGSFTTASALGQQRFADGEGGWVEVDLDMVERADGSVGPAAHPLGLGLPGEGRAEGLSDVSVSHPGAGREVVWRLPLRGEPELDGPVARYADSWPGIDVVIDARRSGFEQTFVIESADAVAGLPGGDQVSWSIPLQAKGLVARQGGEEGVVEFVDAKERVVSQVVAPEAFDAVVDEFSGGPSNLTPVDLQVQQGAGRGKATLTLSVSREWLMDPARVFPVTVDPTYAALNVAPTMDTYVQKAYPSAANASDDELLVGTYNGGTDVARSFLNFSTASLVGKQIKSAQLSLYENWAWSCTAKPVGVYSTSSTASSSVTWSTRPAASSTPVGSVDAAKRSDGTGDCAQGRVKIPMTSLVQTWSGQAAGTKTVMVRAGSETDSSGWKRFYSSESSYPPVLEVTWNRAPATPATPVLASSTSSTYVNPGDGAAQTWTKYKRPRFESSTSDPDGNTVKLEFEVHTANSNVSSATLVASCMSLLRTGGTVVGCTPGVDLSNHMRYFVRARAHDGGGMTGSWSGFKMFYTDWTAGAAPVVSCPAPYTDGSWATNVPTSNVTCRVSGAAASTWDQNVQLKVQVDAGAWKTYSIPNSTDPAVAGVNVTVPRAAGGHNVRVIGVNRTGVETSQVVYSFGYGAAGMAAPVGDPRPTVTGVVPVSAAAPPAQSGQTVSAKIQYRTAGSAGGSDASNWFDAADSVSVAQKDGQSVATGNWNTAAPAVNTNTGADERMPVVLEVQVCFTYGGGATKCTGEADARSVFRVPHAFGDGFPVAEAGPGQVALFTGEFNTTVTDVSVPGYTGQMSLSRSHATYGLPATAAQGVFGPGWVANLDGSDAGLAGATLIDNTLLDGSLVLVGGDGEAIVFDPPSSSSGTYTARKVATLETGAWLPGSEETAAAGISAAVSGSGSSTKVELTDLDGNVTTFTPASSTQAPAAGKAGVFSPASVVEIGVPGQMSFARDSAGRVTRIIAPSPTGVSCPGTGAVTAPGCRVLDITYGTTTSGGEVSGQVKSVSATLFNPAKAGGAGMETTVVASYAYDATTKRLASVTDPRTGLATAYAYDSAGRLTSLTPPGLSAHTLEYTGGTGTVPAQLTAVKQGGTQVARFVYSINPSTPPAGLPALDTATVSAWGQDAAQTPTYAAAVFGQDKPITATTPAAVPAGDWVHAEVQYTTARGYTVNTASYGADQWQVTATGYDQHGNVVRELDASAIAKTGVFGPTGLEDGEQVWSADQVQTLAELTVYNSEDLTAADGTVLAPAGTLETDSYGPARTSHVPGLGVTENVRPHTSLSRCLCK